VGFIVASLPHGLQLRVDRLDKYFRWANLTSRHLVGMCSWAVIGKSAVVRNSCKFQIQPMPLRWATWHTYWCNWLMLFPGGWLRVKFVLGPWLGQEPMLNGLRTAVWGVLARPCWPSFLIFWWVVTSHALSQCRCIRAIHQRRADFLVFTCILHWVHSHGGPLSLPESSGWSIGGTSSLRWGADGIGRSSRRTASTTARVGMASEQLLWATFPDSDVSAGIFRVGK